MKRCLLFTFSICFLISCMQSEPNLAPRVIKGSILNAITTKSQVPNVTYINKVFTYYFHRNNNYKAYLQGEIYNAGNYAYKKTGRNTASISVSYSDIWGLNSYRMILHFHTHTSGTWTSSYYKDKVTEESGTFEIKLNALPRGK